MQVFKSEDTDHHENASNEIRKAKDAEHRKLWVVTFTKMLQTLVDDETTIHLSTPPVKASNIIELESFERANKHKSYHALSGEVNTHSFEVIHDGFDRIMYYTLQCMRQLLPSVN
ncbi:uncharacterized protein LOC113562063 [Ooceraea biroi]|uniref:uncharacterized protein LOC113562063 n=1 Tax=Ooceraea biroi TaxID=2015173 RepID=UPI0005B87862|nr:uncharacterized protein LOC113562063 [Ooceraea biroi]